MATTRRTTDAPATREAILAAARRRFLEHGFSGTSIRDVAADAGVGVSLVMHHVGSKQALWQEVKRGLLAAFVDGMESRLLAGKAGPELLEESLRSYFSWLAEHPDMVRIEAWRDLERQDLTADERRVIELGRVRMREAQAAGLFRVDLDVDLALFAVLAMVSAWHGSTRRRAWPANADRRYIDTVIAMLAGGLLTPRKGAR
ncbi:MAG: TetR/AcrR family transcriptional regulator [Planctomycetes bacterium]|nr:TetR/AcrR family transcriptional regulator [Planctomycetota bacterium]